jgi:hypothetical protein
MPNSSDGVLAECQHLESLLEGIKQRLAVPQPEVLTECEHQLAGVVSSLESLRQSVAAQGNAAAVLRGNATTQQTLQQIQRLARDLSATFLHGANYCAGLLQIRLGAGYSKEGLPVLVAGRPRNSFEG